MRVTLRILAIGICCLGVAAGTVTWIAGLGSPKTAPGATSATGAPRSENTGANRVTFPDPNAPGTGAQIYVEQGDFDIGVGSVAYSYTGKVKDHNSLDELREAVRGRGRRACRPASTV